MIWRKNADSRKECDDYRKKKRRKQSSDTPDIKLAKAKRATFKRIYDKSGDQKSTDHEKNIYSNIAAGNQVNAEVE